MKVELRDYQLNDVENLRQAYNDGYNAPLYVAPTGSGKTVIFSYITEHAAKLGNRVMILVHRKELLMQASDDLDDLNVMHGLIAPKFSQTIDPAQIASVQTLIRRLDKIIPPDLIIIDEGHHIVAGSWKKIIERFPNAKLLGVTATPLRLDGKGLGIDAKGYYDKLVSGPTTRELIDLGYLSQPVVYAPKTELDLTGIRTKYGDYEKGELAKRLDKPTITGDCVEHYLKICPGVPAIVFAASIKHAQHIAEQFNAAGVPSESIDGTLNDSKRKYCISALGDGRIKVLASCDIISEGTDIPVVTAAILLRPTKSLALYLQQVGRCLRPYPGKECSIILDHVGNVFQHGLPDQDREWSLNGVEKRNRNNGEIGESLEFNQCEHCYAVYSIHLRICPQCGCNRKVAGRDVKQVEGELKRIEAQEQQKIKLDNRKEQSQAKTLEDLREIANKRGYHINWAEHVYNARQRKKMAG